MVIRSLKWFLSATACWALFSVLEHLVLNGPYVLMRETGMGSVRECCLW